MRTGFCMSLTCVALAAACSSPAPTGETMTSPNAGTTQVATTPNAATGAGTGATTTASAGTTAARPAGSNAGTTATTSPVSSATSGSSATTTAPGTSAAASAGTTATAPATSNGKPDAGEFFVSGSWSGYVFAKAVGMGSTVMPMDFKMQTTGMPRCIKGSVGAAADYSGTAMLGFGLAEDGGTKMSVTPMKAGVNVQVTNNAGSTLRFQVEGPSGTEDTRWCTEITGSGGFIPWSSLKTKCWGSEGTAYKNEPIVTAMLLVPGGMTAAVPYDFCVNTLAEADGGAMAAAGSGGMSSGAGGTGAAGMSTTTNPGTTNPGNSSPGSCDGYATGYWDCCKPHCGWKSNVQGGSPLAACDKSDNSLGGNVDAQSACNGGNAYQCHNLVPWAVDDKLAYGYSAVPASAQSDICGKCFELQFMGQTHNSEPDPGSTALAGKRMIIQAVNIGADVANGQFDLLVPGRGVGMFDACSSQWGVSKADLGEVYGGFLLACQKKGDRKDHAAMKSCVMQSCMNVFEAHGLSELAAGCKWFIDWFQVADNPKLKYKQVACPAELSGKGIQRNSSATNMCLH